MTIGLRSLSSKINTSSERYLRAVEGDLSESQRPESQDLLTHLRRDIGGNSLM
jgi:hypothetical protein